MCSVFDSTCLTPLTRVGKSVSLGNEDLLLEAVLGDGYKFWHSSQNK